MIILSILGLAVLILVHEAGHFFAARLVGVGVKEFAIGFPPRWFRRTKGETEYTIGVLPLGGFVRLEGENPDEPAEPSRSFSGKSVSARSLVLVAGVFANFVLAALLFSTAFMIGADKEVILSGVASGSPAAIAGLQFGDSLIKVQGEGVQSAEQFISRVEGRRGQLIDLEIKRGEKLLSVQVLARGEPPAGEGPLGVAVSETGWDSLSFWSSLKEGFKEASSYCGLIIFGLWNALTGPGAANLSGPIGVATVAGQAGELGLVYLIHFFGLLSVNLAVLNILPLPALDGGRWLLVLGEAVFRRRVPVSVERYWNAFGISLLLLLMLYVTAQDLIRLF